VQWSDNVLLTSSSLWFGVSVLQGALSERPQIFLDQIRQSVEVSAWSKLLYFSFSSIISQFSDYPLCSSFFDLASYFCSGPLLSSRVWSQPTAEKLTAKKKEATKKRRKGGWLTGINWPVCCVGGSSPARRPSSGTSSSPSCIRWLQRPLDSHVTLFANIDIHRN